MDKTRKLQQRERKRRQKIKNNLIWGGIGVAVVSAIGLVIWQGVHPGVGETVAIPANYAQHVEEGKDPGPFPSNPPAGGRHYSEEFEAGFYEETSSQAQVAYPEGYIGHNLEHGYVVFWYNCTALDETDCETLKNEINVVMDDFGGTKLIAFPWLSMDAPLAMTSWGRIQQFNTFDPKAASAFIKANLNRAPEPNAP